MDRPEASKLFVASAYPRLVAAPIAGKGAPKVNVRSDRCHSMLCGGVRNSFKRVDLH